MGINFQKERRIKMAEHKIGIIGFGRIGKDVAKKAHAFGMRTLELAR